MSSASILDDLVFGLTATGPLDPGFGRADRKLSDVGGPDDSFSGVALSRDAIGLVAVGSVGRDTSGGEKDDGAVPWLGP